jgi:hypothetical protein
MKTVGWIGILSAGIVLTAGAAQAQSSKPQDRNSRETAAFTGQMNSLNRECGTSITASFDWTGADEKDLSEYSAGGWCGDAMDAIKRVCDDAPGKQAVQEKIKHLTCGFGQPRTLSLKDGGTVEYKMDFKAYNNGDFLFEALENAL